MSMPVSDAKLAEGEIDWALRNLVGHIMEECGIRGMTPKNGELQDRLVALMQGREAAAEARGRAEGRDEREGFQPLLPDEHAFAPGRCNHPVGTGSCVEAEDHVGPHVAHNHYELFAAEQVMRIQAQRERDEALAFLKKASFYGLEIVSTARLTELQIANFREAGFMYVEPGGGLGWVVRRSAPPQWQADQDKELGGAFQRGRETAEKEIVAWLRQEAREDASLWDTAARALAYKIEEGSHRQKGPE